MDQLSREPKDSSSLRRVIHTGISVIGFLLVASSVVFFVSLGALIMFQDRIAEIITSNWEAVFASSRMTDEVLPNNFLVIFGLPSAALLSLVLVVFLRVGSGPIQFELGPIKMKGASEPITLWVICFLSMAFSIWLLSKH